jgi:hypothetical protein
MSREVHSSKVVEEVCLSFEVPPIGCGGPPIGVGGLDIICCCGGRLHQIHNKQGFCNPLP